MSITTVQRFLVAVVALCLSPLANADTYTYDALNRLTQVQYTSGASLTYSYDPAGNRVSSTSTPALLVQTITFGSAPTVYVGSTGVVTATATSGLAVSLRSNSAGVCSVTGTQVSGLAVGFCTVAASQLGNSVYATAPEVLQIFSVSAALTMPGAPSIMSIVPGPGRVTLTLQAPSNTGGGAIVSYSATCTATGQPTMTASSATTTVVVTRLVAGASYACTAQASNGGYASLPTPAVAAIPAPNTDLTPILMLLLD